MDNINTQNMVSVAGSKQGLYEAITHLRGE